VAKLFIVTPAGSGYAALRSNAWSCFVKARPLPDTHPVRWEPDRSAILPPWPMPPLVVALARGLTGRCPACGKAHLFDGYLRVVPTCRNCGVPLGLVRADDAPPYFTILVVGHIIIPGMIILEKTAAPPLLVQAIIWLPLTLILTLALLRPIKGATVGLMLKLGLLNSGLDD
jgi:uncharacterized protein (DUF983 family)